jgi:hypothetical protein
MMLRFEAIPPLKMPDLWRGMAKPIAPNETDGASRMGLQTDRIPLTTGGIIESLRPACREVSFIGGDWSFGLLHDARPPT